LNGNVPVTFEGHFSIHYKGLAMWTRRDSIGLMSAACAAFALTLGLFWSTPIHAVDAEAVEKTIPTPVYKDGSCEVTASLAAKDGILATRQGLTFVKPGAVPAMQLTVHNTGKEAATTHFKVALNQTSMRDRVSRVAVPRPPAWSQDYDISLAPDETKTIDLQCGDLKVAQSDSLLLFIGSPVSAPVVNAAGSNVAVSNAAIANTNGTPDQAALVQAVNRNVVVVNNRVNLLQMSCAEKMPEVQSASTGITY